MIEQQEPRPFRADIRQLTNGSFLRAVGDRVRHFRILKKLAVAEVADKAKLTDGAISRIERLGEDMYLSSFLKICIALDIHPVDLLCETDQEKKSRYAAEIKEKIADMSLDELAALSDLVKGGWKK